MHHLMDEEDASRTDEHQVNTGNQTSNNDNVESSIEMLPVPLVEQREERETRAALVAGSKRQQHFPEDDLTILSKHPKLAIAPQSFEPGQIQSVSSSSSDEFRDESSDSDNRSQGANTHPSDNLHSHSSEGDIQNEDPAELDSDVSEAISPQRQIMDHDLISRIEERQTNEAINKFMSVSAAMRLQTHTTHSSQVSNNDLENNNINQVGSSEVTIKQSNSQLFNSSDNEPMNVISIPENSSLVNAEEEYHEAEGSDEIETHNNDDTEQETGLQVADPRILYAVANQSLMNLKTESSSSQDRNSESFREISQEKIDAEQSIRSIVYAPVHESRVLDMQVPSTSRGFEESNHELSRVGSVSDLSLAHLVLGLRDDIQKLTQKVEKQQQILGAVVHVNEVNLTPLFTSSFQEKYNLQVPFTRLEDFLKFNDDLTRDANFRNEFTTSLLGYIDTQMSFAKNVLNMVKPYMSKELALLFNASKQTPNKMVLKDTMFCKCLLQATMMTNLKNGKLPLEHEKLFMKNLGHVISGARSWHNASDE